MEIRQPSPGDARAIRELGVLSFNVPPSWIEKGPPLQVAQYLCAYEGAKLLATTRDIPMRQWFGGRPLPAAGVAAVAVVPELRGTGVGDELMRALLRRARDRGAIVTSLFPATVPFYRRLGYEYGGTWTIFQAPLHALPRGSRDVAIELVEGGDVSELQACYRAFAEGKTGLIEGDGDEWWHTRILARWITVTAVRTVVARGPHGVEGYASFSLETRGEWKGYDIDCSHLVATTPGALSALLGYFRRYKGVGRGLAWQGPPNEPLALMLDEETIRIKQQYRYMTRLLDVPSALEARGYPETVSGEATIEVGDPVFDDNRGPFRIVAEDGKVRVERADGDALRLSMRALSGMFSGFFSPHDLAVSGELEAGLPALAFLGALFSGPPPWMMDHF